MKKKSLSNILFLLLVLLTVVVYQFLIKGKEFSSIDTTNKIIQDAEQSVSQIQSTLSSEKLGIIDTSKNYIYEYLAENETLPNYYISKRLAKDQGWIPSEGNLWEILPHHVIGGDVFSNREGILPKKKGRIYYECDINYQGGRRGAERIVFSNDGLIFYTSDHYESFERLK